MKRLELNQMEGLEGGVNCTDGLGFAVGLSAAFVFGTIATGGALLLAFGTIAAFGGGSILAVGNCRETGWN
jgi:hypothetical protein